MGSGSGETKVHRDALIAQAKFWDQASGEIGGYGRDAAASTYYGSAGVFSEFVDVYNQLTMNVSNWCGEGQAQLEDIATALVKAAQRYDKTEAANEGAAARVGPR
jgi:hypothetical protein